MRKLSSVCIGMALLLTLVFTNGTPADAAGTVTATRTDGAGWSAVYQRTATGGYINGPATPPAGAGSYHMTTGAGNSGPDLPQGGAGTGGKIWLATQTFDSTKLGSITALSYSTYIAASPSSPTIAPAIDLQVDMDGNGTRDTTMVFEPIYSTVADGGTQHDIAQGAWQMWDAQAGSWWLTKSFGTFCAGATAGCYVTLAQVAAAYPNAQIVTWYSAVDGYGTAMVAGQNSAGAPWQGFDGNVDAFTLNTTTYDFELGAGAATYHVSPTGSDNGCDGLVNAAATATPHCAFKTIQYAIGQSLDGDTVLVHTGTYNESPNVNKSIVLQAPEGCSQTTIALQSQPPATTYLGSLEIAAPNVTVDGFTITGFDGTAKTPASTNIYIHSSLNTIALTNNCLQVGAINDTSTNGDDGYGILTTYTVTPAQLVNTVTATGNTFAPVNTEGGRAFYINPGVNTFTFQNNQITGDFTETALTQAKSATVSGNTITGTGAAGSRSAGLGAWGFPDPAVWGHATFQNNTISGTRRGVSIYTAQGVTVTQNTFDHNGDAVWLGLADPADAQPGASTISSCNRFTASDSHGVNNTLTGTIDATHNWWGSPTGPTHPTNVGGSGDAVSDNVTFSPWSGDVGCTLSYGIPTKLTFTTQPGNGTPGAALATQPVVTAQDASGNLGFNFAGPVALAFGANPGAATLGGTTPVNAVNGVATFSGISVSAVGTGYTLAASGGGLTSATSSPFDVAPLVPTITSLDVTSGVPAGGTTVVITGTNFVSGDTVTFGGVPATDIQVLSSTQISVKTPAHASGKVDVQVLNTNGQGGTLTNGYTYTVAVSSLSGITIAGPGGASAPTIKVGQVAQLTALGTYTDGSKPDVTSQSQWSSDSPNVAKVDATGKVTGISPGPATITASYGGQIQTIVVTVSSPTLVGVAPAPAPQSRPSGASAPATGAPAPVAAPSGR